MSRCAAFPMAVVYESLPNGTALSRSAAASSFVASSQCVDSTHQTPGRKLLVRRTSNSSSLVTTSAPSCPTCCVRRGWLLAIGAQCVESTHAPATKAFPVSSPRETLSVPITESAAFGVQRFTGLVMCRLDTLPSPEKEKARRSGLSYRSTRARLNQPGFTLNSWLISSRICVSWASDSTPVLSLTVKLLVSLVMLPA